LDLVKATGGRLSLPKMFLDSQLGKLRGAIEAKMPEWRQDASMEQTGAVNRSTAAAAMGNLLLCAMANKPAPAVLFMPDDEGAKKLLPVRVEDVKVENESLTLKLAPMDQKSREKMFKEVAGK
jgi:phosphoketolase